MHHCRWYMVHVQRLKDNDWFDEISLYVHGSHGWWLTHPDNKVLEKLFLIRLSIFFFFLLLLIVFGCVAVVIELPFALYKSKNIYFCMWRVRFNSTVAIPFPSFLSYQIIIIYFCVTSFWLYWKNIFTIEKLSLHNWFYFSFAWFLYWLFTSVACWDRIVIIFWQKLGV